MGSFFCCLLFFFFPPPPLAFFLLPWELLPKQPNSEPHPGLAPAAGLLPPISGFGWTHRGIYTLALACGVG